MAKRITQATLESIYRQIDSRVPPKHKGLWDDWWKGVFSDMRRVIRARNLPLAAKILEDSGWYNPENAAREIRSLAGIGPKLVTCTKCKGAGQVYV